MLHTTHLPTMTKHCNVLLVDDDDVDAFLAARLMRQMSSTWQISCVKDGQEAFELMGKEAFDMILLDVNMPAMSGLEFLELLKQREEQEGVEVPFVVMLTSSCDPLDRIKAEQLLVNDYLSKPLTENQVKYLLNLTVEER